MIFSLNINTLSNWKPSRIKVCLFLVILITVFTAFVEYHKAIEVKILTQSHLQTPQSHLQTPQSHLQTPQSHLLTPQSLLLTPQSHLQTPQSHLLTPQSLLQTPQSHLQTPQSPLQTPQSHLQTPQSHLQTPQSHLRTPQSLLRTPQNLSQSALPDQCGHKNGTWYNFTSGTFRLYAYSAFYDDRPSLLSPPVVRIIAISDDFEARKKFSLYCVLHHSANNVSVLRMEENPRPVGAGWPLNRRQAKEYVYTCPTVEGLIPTSVSIAVEQSGGNVTSCLPVTFPNKPQQKRDFCVCVQVAYGTLEPNRLIEWLEILKVLGVSLVGVYDLSVSDEGLKVLRHYASEGFVDLHKTNAIYENDDAHYLLQGSPVINDCIYRHMYEFRRIAVFDFDEIIIPRKHNNLSELVSYLDENSPRINYVFRNNYFFLDLPPDDTIPSNFTVLRFRKRVLVSLEGYSVKSLINPQACTHMHNHYCWGLTANYSRHGGNTGDVDPEIGLNQHYKKCHFSKDECLSMMRNVTQDDVILRFKDAVIERVTEKLTSIMN